MAFLGKFTYASWLLVAFHLTVVTSSLVRRSLHADWSRRTAVNQSAFFSQSNASRPSLSEAKSGDIIDAIISRRARAISDNLMMNNHDDDDDYDYFEYDADYNHILSRHSTSTISSLSALSTDEGATSVQPAFSRRQHKMAEKSKRGHHDNADTSEHVPHVGLLPPPFPLPAGRAFTWHVPAATFTDLHDGDARELQVSVLQHNGDPLSRDHWLQFNSSSQTVYALPLERDEGRHEYMLRAVNSVAARVSVPLIITVLSSSSSDDPGSHQLSLTFTTDPLQSLPTTSTSILQPPHVSWQMSVLRRLSTLVSRVSLGGATVVRAVVSQHHQHRVTVSFSSLDDTRQCATDKLSQLRQLLFTVDGNMSSTLIESFSVQDSVAAARLISAHLQLTGVCQQVELPLLPHLAPPLPPSPSPYTSPQMGGATDTSAPSADVSDKSSVSNNAPWRISANVGRLIDIKVDKNLFINDKNADSCNIASITLLNDQDAPVSPHIWLQLDADHHTLTGLPSLQQLGSHNFSLECKRESGDERLLVPIIVHVSNGTVSAIKPVLSYEAVLSESSAQVHLAGSLQHAQLARLLASVTDAPADQLLFNITTNHQSASVTVRWYNTSLTASDVTHCPVAAVLQQRQLNSEAAVRQKLAPHFDVRQVNSQLHGVCSTIPSVNKTDGDDDDERGAAAEAAASRSAALHVLLYVVPSVAVVILLLASAVIVWRLTRRRRRSRKMTVVRPSIGSPAGDNNSATVVASVSAEEMMELAPALSSPCSPPASNYNNNGTATAETPMLADNGLSSTPPV